MRNLIWGILYFIAGIGTIIVPTDSPIKVVAVGVFIILFIWGIFDPQIDWLNWPDWPERR